MLTAQATAAFDNRHAGRRAMTTAAVAKMASVPTAGESNAKQEWVERQS